MTSIEATSLRDASNKRPDVSIASVKMLFDNDINAGKVVFVVEGKDDVDFYASFLQANSVCIYPDGNCAKHIVILKALNGIYGDRLLAVKDADFDRLEGHNSPFENLLLTDTHDMEGMVLSNGIPPMDGEDAERCKNIDLGVLYVELEDVSFLKWYSHANSLRLDFNGISLDLSMASYLHAVLANTQKAVKVTLDEVLAFKQHNAGASKKELCNGHDLFERIYVYARSVSKSNFAKRPFFRRLRKAYTKERFATTVLCQSIKTWEKTHRHSILAG